MKASDFQPLICGRCSLEFLIPKKHYNPDDAYACPLCISTNIVTPEDLKPVKKFRPHDPTKKEYSRQNNKREK